MADTGWPLIGREQIPASVTPAPVAGRVARTAKIGGWLPAARQLPIFGADTTEASPSDLVGLLAGPGRLYRMGGTARVSVRVDAAWRVHVLVPELVSRGLVVNWTRVLDDQRDDGVVRDLTREPVEVSEAPDQEGEPPPAGHEPDHEETGDSAAGDARPVVVGFDVATAYSRRLNGLARAWPAAADQLFLSGPRLRLWVAAAGRPWPGGYALGLDPGRDPARDSEKDLEIVGDALVRAGLHARRDEDHSHWLIAGRKRVRRLAELVGERPAAAPREAWPGGAGA